MCSQHNLSDSYLMTSAHQVDLYYDLCERGGVEKMFIVEKTFKFVDIFDNVDSSFCNVTIKVMEKISGGKPIYDISYSYEYSNKDSMRANPFFYSKNIEESDKEGVIVYKNDMTDQMINYLLMDSDELSQKCGMFWVQYKIKIMESLANLWD